MNHRTHKRYMIATIFAANLALYFQWKIELIGMHVYSVLMIILAAQALIPYFKADISVRNEYLWWFDIVGFYALCFPILDFFNKMTVKTLLTLTLVTFALIFIRHKYLTRSA